MVLLILFKSFLALVSALFGVGLTFIIKLNHKKLCVLISLSAGALLGAAAFTLIPESSKQLNILELFFSVLSGYLVFLVISRYYSHVCPACSASHFDERTTKKFSEIFFTLFTALAFHSLLDGAAISAGDLQNHEEQSSIFLAILTHKFPEGLALASLMLGAGLKKTKIILYAALVEATTLLGSLVGIFLLKEGISFFWISLLMAHIAGGFIYLAIHAVMGEMLRNHRTLVVTSLLSGFLLILFVHTLID
ncbi:MAG: ZIP family metal transporter [Ignavibacteria bacterium]|nr:ZIP family metal transporter [Ignavibacteria bacterium]